MSDHHIRNVVEAALLVAGKSLSIADLAQLFDEQSRPDSAALRAALDELAAGYDGRAVEIKETASGFRIQVRTQYAGEVGRLWPERAQRYSRALLETLALVAYRQPITRAEIEGVRGVAVNPNIIKTLTERNWLRVVGHREVPGRPELLATTREFLDYFGLKSIDNLPPLAELKALADSHLQLDLPGTALDVAEHGSGEPPTASGSAGDETVYAFDALDDHDDGESDDSPPPVHGASGGLVAASRDPED